MLTEWSGRFYGISPLDPLTRWSQYRSPWAAVTAAASLVPAHRAASIDPVSAMRSD